MLLLSSSVLLSKARGYLRLSIAPPASCFHSSLQVYPSCSDHLSCRGHTGPPFLLSYCWQCCCHSHFMPRFLRAAALYVPSVAGRVVSMMGGDQVGFSSQSSCPPAQLLLVATVHAALSAWHRCKELFPWDNAQPRTILCHQTLFCLINFHLSSYGNGICLWCD